MFTQIELITPQIAAEYLSKNVENNRKLSPQRIDEYAKEMKRGDWILTHQGIAFDEDDNLIDGQNRLSAIIKANIPVQMTVTRGVDKKSMFVVDIGKARRPVDIANINNENYHVIKSLTAANTILRIYGIEAYACTAKVVIDFIHANETAFYKLLSVINGRTKQVPSIVQVALFCALVNGVDSDEITKFVQLWLNNEVNGMEMYNVKAVLNYRERIRGRTLKTIEALKEAEAIVHCFIANTLRPKPKLWYPIINKIVWTINPVANRE